jgi:hypothetical protein
MTMSEFMVESLTRGDSGPTYAGGMTKGDLEDIKEASAAFKKKRALANGTDST